MTNTVVNYRGTLKQLLIEFNLGALKSDLSTKDTLQSMPLKFVYNETNLLDYYEYIVFNLCNEKRVFARISSFESMLSKGIENSIRIEEIATHMHLSSRHLHRTIKEATDLAPKQIFNLFLLHKIIEKLSQQSLPAGIKEISYGLHFHDMAHFSKFFKKTYGINPKKFLSISNHIALEYYAKDLE
ncbi:MAG: helix-turn-helix transcriptional regulator [Bacteroidota bacterium]